jgi:translation initiation factor IF-2
MSDTDGKKPLGLRGGAGGGPRSGSVKQSFSHGRTKSVVVETKRKRVLVPKPGAKSGADRNDPAKPGGATDAEMERRLRALQNAKAREADDEKQRADEERQREEERARRRAEIEAKEREEREREERAKARAEEEERQRAEAAQAKAAPDARPGG